MKIRTLQDAIDFAHQHNIDPRAVRLDLVGMLDMERGPMLVDPHEEGRERMSETIRTVLDVQSGPRFVPAPSWEVVHDVRSGTYRNERMR